jgi:hypothetical protein
MLFPMILPSAISSCWLLFRQAAAELLRPLYQRQKELVLQSPVLWTDDTPVTALTGGQSGRRLGRFGPTSASSIPTRCMTSPKVAPAMGQHSSSRDSTVTSTPMPTAVTTTFIFGRTTRSARLLVGRMCGADFSTRGTVDHVRRTSSWAGSGSYTTSRSGAATCQPPRGGKSVLGKQDRCLIASARASPNSRSMRCPRVHSRRPSGTSAIGGRRYAATRRMVDRRLIIMSANSASSGDRMEELVVPGERASWVASCPLIHDPRRGQASSDRTVDLPTRVAAPSPRRRSTSR